MQIESFVADCREQVRQQLDFSMHITDEQLFHTIEQTVLQSDVADKMTTNEKLKLIYRIFHSFRGLDVIQELVEDEEVTEIMVNSYDDIFIERDGKVIPTSLRFESEEKLEDIIQFIVAKVNRTVNEAHPIVDARLEDGSRVNVVLPPIALRGPALTIRKFPKQPMTMEDLVLRGTLTEEAAQFLHTLVQSKYNIFISGGTGAGKTTFLNALAQSIPEDERLITIEDSAELQIPADRNVVRLETRNANTEGKGEITIRQLIRASLRMRPNRIIVGEVRGEESMDMLQAMNTGHDGSLSTGHANSVVDMLSRLETMALGGTALPLAAVRKQIHSALDIMVHLSRMRDHSRKVTQICEVGQMNNGEIELHPLFEFNESSRTLHYTRQKMSRVYKLALAGHQRILGQAL